MNGRNVVFLIGQIHMGNLCVSAQSRSWWEEKDKCRTHLNSLWIVLYRGDEKESVR